jgi:AraC family transcriptional regulator, regulatory protein of adaptative response / methylated-DNA-[protein]-cysteine methyltransferase
MDPTPTLGYALMTLPIGVLCVATTGRGVRCALFEDDGRSASERLAREHPSERLIPDDDAAADAGRRIVELIECPAPASVPLDLRGTPFQLRVWSALQAIPAGQSRTYAELAASIGAPNAVRAVAGACASNRIAILVPCHRVVRTGGGLGGFRWGIERKRWLLEREGLGVVRETS